MTKVYTVARQIQQLEIYLNNLVSALTRGELPVNLQPVTQIFDNAISAIAPILNLSEDRFIEVYNDIPQILTAYAIDVTLSGDSYRKRDDNVTFNRLHRGNYWIIPTQELIDKAWLVPNPLKSLLLDRMPSLDASFDRDIINENKDLYFQEYFLVAPALVQIFPIVEPLTWELLERGKITSSQIQKPTITIAAIENLYEQLDRNNHRQDRLVNDRDEDELLKESARIKDIIVLQDKKIVSLKLQIESLEVNRNLDLHTRLEELTNRTKYREAILSKRLDKQRDNIDRLQRTIDGFVNIPEIKSILLSDRAATARSINSPKMQNKDSIDDNSLSIPSDVELNKTPQKEEVPTPSAPTLTQIGQDIISEYYHNLGKFAEKYQVKTVNVTKESISANWGNEKKNVVLEEFNRGNYWIFNLEDNIYLVPAKEIDIDQSTYTTTSTIFEGHNYTLDYQKIQLIKPAIVSIEPNTNPQTWRLQQQGELVFL